MLRALLTFVFLVQNLYPCNLIYDTSTNTKEKRLQINLKGNRMIDTDGLTKKFGDLTAVDNLTLHVDDGEVFGFLGPNGAGKTTTVRMLCCLISKTSGSGKMGGL